MPAMSAKTRTNETTRAYLLRGDDDFRKQKDLEKLLESLVSSDFSDFDLELLEGDSATSDRVINGLNVPPFGSKQRLVLVKHANKMPPDEQEKLAPRLMKAPETGCLILVNPAAEKVDGKPKKGSEVIGELSKAVRKVGEVREFGGEKPMERNQKAREFAISTFAQAGKKIDSQALGVFLQRSGSDFAIVASESQKLIDYSGESERITTQDILALTCETPEEKVFKMVDAIAAKNSAAALKHLDELSRSEMTLRPTLRRPCRPSRGSSGSSGR